MFYFDQIFISNKQSIVFSIILTRIYCQSFSQMNSSSGSPSMNIKIVLLKQTSRRQALYQSSDINQDLCQRFSTQHRPNKSINSNSIAYLSSIIQDENILTQNSTITAHIRSNSSHAAQWVHSRSSKMNNYRKLSSKKGNRYLSCLLGSDGRYCIPNAKKIDSVIASKKVMPIDKLQYKKKIIKFSLKNKQDLNKDFQDFVQQKAQNQQLQYNRKPKQKHNQTVVTNRKDNLTHFTSMKQRQKIRKMKPVLNENENVRQQIQSPQKNVKQGFAMIFKRLNNDLALVHNFGWSKLNESSYNRH